MRVSAFVLLLLSLLLNISPLSADTGGSGDNVYEHPKREFRGAWIHIVGNKSLATMSTQELKEMFVRTIDSIALAGCNAVIFQVRPAADAFYDSEIEPWTRYLTGFQGVVPQPYWDPLEFAIEESHKRGMELHAWCNPYRVTLEESDTLARSHIYYSHPEIFVKHGKQIYFNPAEPLSRKHTVKVIADIVRRYDIDAIHFDDYFYPYPIPGVEFDDEASFNKYAKAQGFTRERKSDWRRHNVTLLIKELNDTIKAIKPWVRFGISPFGIHRNKKDTPDGSGSETNGLSNYEQLYADVPLWVSKGYIDYNVPQIYWRIGHSKADYETLIKWWNKNTRRGHLYVGQSISTFSEPDLKNKKTTQMARKMELVRELSNVDGNVWWPGWSISRNSVKIADSLIMKYQRYPALVPPYRELDSKAPKAVEEIYKDGRYGRCIKWNQSEKEAADPMQEALFYVVYCFPEGVKVDIRNPRYIKKITKDTEYNVIEENKEHGAGCKYVVTVVDRCWNESLPSKVLWY